MDEKTLRDLLRQGVALGEDIAAITPNLIDDKVLFVLGSVVQDDRYWSIAWRVIEKLIGYMDVENQRLVAGADPDTAVLAEQAGIDPATLLVVIQTIMTIVKWWKNRK